MDSPTAVHSRVERIAVVGLGNVGRLIADMLVERGFEVREVDADESRAAGERASLMDVRDPAALEELFAGVDAVISCLPYYLNTGVATAAHSAGVHYLDLSEDVATSRTVRQLAESSNRIFMPRCGLAPGFICIVGGALAARLEIVDRIELRAGALPRSPNNALGYACNWSPAGIINEYLNDCEQLRGGELVSVPPLSDLETIVIDGARYEAFTTSGGLGTMCETLPTAPGPPSHGRQPRGRSGWSSCLPRARCRTRASSARKTCRSTPSSPPRQVRCSRANPPRRCATTCPCCQSLDDFGLPEVLAQTTGGDAAVAP